ncbi:hypothetical protein CONLIGDRAFT_649001 [Coniochaeta ligniaria NRRL 30616]|uniref:Uncharacterized protein n=1 Tax=Coniochaeta ligniaria NRRL 30616 TaxID=1408157 RepID=A0A1J7IA98_9PEZI|nr:hypothetical protein CONLIGDRAFT_649001 [Coniochaeta ligniaria NRRL 30616]
MTQSGRCGGMDSLGEIDPSLSNHPTISPSIFVNEHCIDRDAPKWKLAGKIEAPLPSDKALVAVCSSGNVRQRPMLQTSLQTQGATPTFRDNTSPIEQTRHLDYPRRQQRLDLKTVTSLQTHHSSSEHVAIPQPQPEALRFEKGTSRHGIVFRGHRSFSKAGSAVSKGQVVCMLLSHKLLTRKRPACERWFAPLRSCRRARLQRYAQTHTTSGSLGSERGEDHTQAPVDHTLRSMAISRRSVSLKRRPDDNATVYDGLAKISTRLVPDITSNFFHEGLSGCCPLQGPP